MNCDVLIPVLQFKETVAQRRQFCLQLYKIGGMRKVACPEKGDPLLLGPSGKGFHIHLLARGPAVFRMKMEISDEPHRKT